MPLRFIAWLAATALSTGVLAFLPAPDSWPLPTGMGGLIGGGFMQMPFDRLSVLRLGLNGRNGAAGHSIVSRVVPGKHFAIERVLVTNI